MKEYIKNIIYKVRRLLYPPKIPKNSDGKVLIHLGCGRINNTKFINIDAVSFPHIHYVQDIRKLSALPDDFADLLYSSHALEHISHLELLTTIKEWVRVIKKGGTIRLSVPDFDKILEMYQVSGNDIKSIKDPLMGGQDYAYNFHKSVFNEKYLSELLNEVGIHNIRKWDASKNNYNFNDFANKFKGSLNLEGEKA